MTSTSSRAASPPPSSPPINPRLQINTSIQTDNENAESTTSGFQRSSAPSPSPTLSSPSQPLPSKVEPTASQLEPTPTIYSPRPDPLPNSADATRSTSPVGVGPTRPNSPARLVNEDEPLVPEAPSSPLLAHSVPIPVPMGARVVVPGLIEDGEREAGQGSKTTMITMLRTAGATDIIPEEEDSSARLSTGLDTDLDTGIATDTYKLTPSLISDVPSTSTRESPDREPKTAMVAEGEGKEGAEDGRKHSHVFQNSCGGG